MNQPKVRMWAKFVLSPKSGKTPKYVLTDACGWVLGNDGYYYYQNIVNSTDKNQVSVFTETYIPTSWGAEIRNKSFEVKIHAEAVQSEYMNPIRDNNNKIIGWNN